MKIQNHELNIPFSVIRSRNNEYIEWLHENDIGYKCIEEMRQAPGYPLGWECIGPVLKFERIEDIVAFKLRWL